LVVVAAAEAVVGMEGEMGVVAGVKREAWYTSALELGKEPGASSCQRRWGGSMPRHCSSWRAS
jgi:hypothetical protein